MQCFLSYQENRSLTGANLGNVWHQLEATREIMLTCLRSSEFSRRYRGSNTILCNSFSHVENAETCEVYKYNRIKELW